jgi:hypothetical protein
MTQAAAILKDVPETENIAEETAKPDETSVSPALAEVLSGFDAAFCPNPVPTESEFDVVEFYAGGTSAFHIWTPAERSLIKGRLTLPIWVPTPGLDNPTQVAEGIAATLKSLGIPSHATPYRAVMLDMETSTDAEFITLCCNKLASFGYDSYIYGSAGSVFNLPSRSGYIVADPTGIAHIYDHPDVIGTQYAWGVNLVGGQVDADLYLEAIKPHLSILP